MVISGIIGPTAIIGTLVDGNFSSSGDVVYSEGYLGLIGGDVSSYHVFNEAEITFDGSIPEDSKGFSFFFPFLK